MSVKVENVTERELRFGVLKLGLSLTFGLLLTAYILSLVFAWEKGVVFAIVLNALLLAVAVSILATGMLAVLKIIDWFEARRIRRNAK